MLGRTCQPRSRASRAVDGLVIGGAVGLIGGAIVGGILYAFDPTSPRIAKYVALGVFGFAIVAETALSTQLPEC